MTAPRCADCGFLAARDVQTRELAEVEIGMRTKWELPTILNVQKYRYDEIPLCFARAHRLDEEIGSYTKERVLEVIAKARNCVSFTPWLHGFTPKEHADMRREELIRTEQQRQRESDLAFQAEQRQRDDERRERDRVEAVAQRERDQERDERIRKQDKEDAERVRQEDREWKAEQDARQWRRGIMSAVAVAVIAALLAVLAEPWKQKDRQPTPVNESQASPATKP